MAEEQPPAAEGSSEDRDAMAEEQPPGTEDPSSTEDAHATADGAATERRTLRRSSTDKVIAGVAGGIGAYFGIDSVIVRIAFILLTFLGGAGPFLYLIGWLALPTEDSPSVIAKALGGGTPNRFRSLLAVALIGLGLLITANLSGDLFDLFVDVWSIAPYLALILIAAGVALVVWPGTTGRPEPTPARPPVPPVSDTPAPPPPTAAGPDWTSSPIEGYPPAPEQPRRERSMIGVLTIAVLLVYAGGAVMLSRLDALEVDIAAFFAIALAITGVGLVASAFARPARGLLVTGAVLLPVAVLFAGAEVSWHKEIGDSRVKPASTAELQRRYDHGIGGYVMDLRRLEPDGSDRAVDVDLGIGQLVVYVPDNIQLVADVDIGAGSVVHRDRSLSDEGDGDYSSFESQNYVGGLGVDTVVVSPAPGGRRSGQDFDMELDFDIDVGIGTVEVITVPAPEKGIEP